MAEQQLVDYIKKAREAGQSDDQTRDLLSKNGWTNAEINEAIMAQTQSQPEPKPQPEIVSQPKPEPQPQPVSQPQPVDLSKNIQIEEIKPQVASQPQPQPQPELQVQPQIQSQPKPEPVDLSKIETQPQIMVETIDISKIGTQPQPEPQTQVQITKQPEPQYQPQFAQNNMPQTRGGMQVVLKILMVLIILFVIGLIGYFTAGQYFNLPYSSFLQNLFSPNPQTVINNMVANMKDVKSSHTIMQFEVNAINNGTAYGKLLLNTNSQTDITDVKNPKMAGNFTINLTVPGSDSPMVSSTISLASIDEVHYLKINEITTSDEFDTALSSASELDISKIKGKWFKIDKDSIKILSQTNSMLPPMLDVSQIGNSGLSKNILDLILAENMFNVSKQLNDQKIGGQDTYHYLITISKDKLKDLITKIIISSSATDTSKSGTAYKNIIEAAVKTATDSLGDINMELWIGKRDYMLHQVKLDKTIDLGAIAKSYYGEADSADINPQLEIKFNLTNSSFNEPITVQAPTGAQKIEEILLPLVKIQKIQADMSQIMVSAAILNSENNNSYTSLCKSGFLNGSKKTSYGLDFISAVNDIIKQGAKNPICFATAKDYCVSTQLKNGSYICVSDDGSKGTVKCTSAKTICK